MLRILTIGFALILGLVEGVAGQDTSSQTDERTSLTYYRLLQEARQHFASEDFDTAASLYQRLVAQNLHDGENWLRLAQSNQSLGRCRPAIEAYQKAIGLGFGFLVSNHYQIVVCYATLGEDEEALKWLAKTLNAGYMYRPQFAQDEQLTRLRSDERFRQLAGLLPGRALSRDEGRRFDLAFLVSELERLHVIYRKESLPEEFKEAVRQLHDQIPERTDVQVFVALQRLAAMIGDGHTAVYPVAERLSFSQLPVEFYVFPDGLYLIDAEGDLKERVGSRVVQIGNMETQAALEVISTVISHDNSMTLKWLMPLYLTFPEVLLGLGIIGALDAVPLRLEDATGQTLMMEVESDEFRWRRKLFPSQREGVPAPPLYLRNVEDYYWFEYLPEAQTLYVQFNQVINKQDEPIRVFAQRVEKALEDHDAKHLIVDVRHNNGGNTYLYPPLLRMLSYFEATRKDGKLFVFIGRSTYSAAQNFITDVDRLTDAVFVGEPSGGTPNAPGEETGVVLPYSGVQMSISALNWQHSYPEDARIWIAPDIPVVLTAEEYFSNRDPALEAVLELIQTNHSEAEK